MPLDSDSPYKPHFFMREKVAEAYKNENAEKLILLGDLLYHGPRNDLPKDYNPKGVIALLNSMKQEILAVRGNCEAEVDQMVLEFPVMAEYMIMYLENRMVFVTHGHKFNTSNPPMLKDNDILIHGHTHVQAMEKVDINSVLLTVGILLLYTNFVRSANKN